MYAAMYLCIIADFTLLHYCPVRSLHLPRLFLNEYLERITDVCYDYVVDSLARGRDWLSELNGVDITLRSHVRR